MTGLADYAATVTQPALGDEPPRYDEVVDADGSLRPAWRALAAGTMGLTEPELRRIGRDIERQLGDDGVTYGRPGERRSRWHLDPLPLVLTAEEWGPLEVGLAQRTELLNAVLLDLYGPQRLLAEGVLPPEVVFGHAGYLRVVARGSSVDPRPLLVAAADLGRTASGEWQVVGDRAQAPSGIGYAMENRHVISRSLPGLYRDAGLHRMAPFMQALRSTLMQAAPADVADPRVVVLSPGTRSETAYDQAFVASTLGFPLVQGSDLVVRDGAVWLRVVDRLERVDVVLRRVDADWSDPLELRGDSHLGVAGLVEAVRRGTVRVVNGLGSGVLENPGLLPFLSAACELLLDEPLRLPSVRTHWLGDPRALARARDDLDGLVVRSIDRVGEPGPRASPDAVLAAVEAAPHRFVAQERPVLSQAPRVGRRGVAPMPLTVRAFTIHYGSAYRSLMGGLATVHDGPRAATSKDVWVLKARPEEPDQGLAEVLPLTSASAAAAFVPRVLEDLFWAGRYAERAEDTLRLLLAAHALAEDFRARPHSAGGAALAVLHEALRSLSPAPAGVDGLDDDFRSVLLDLDRPASAAQSLAALRLAAEGVRDQLSLDVWRAFASVDRAADLLVDDPSSPQVSESAERMLTGLLALHGATASMMRDPGWHALEAGRALERCLQVCLLLRRTATVRGGIDVDRHLHGAVLAVAESAVTHRRRYRGSVRVASVVQLLLDEESNPRSVAANLRALRTHLAALPTSTGTTRPERLLDDLEAELGRVDVASLVAIEGERRPNLERHLDNLADRLARLADALAAVHLASGPAPRSFGLVGAVGP